jgi:hypothetical protein
MWRQRAAAIVEETIKGGRKVKRHVFEEGYGWMPIERAPLDQDVQLVVTDDQGELYMLRMPCRRTAAGWISSAKGTPLVVTPVKWKFARWHR